MSGWRQFVTEEPFIRNNNIVVLGDSCCHVYSSTGKKHHSIVSDLRTSVGCPNVHDLTEVGHTRTVSSSCSGTGSTGT